jgi:hypothetical protein
MAYSQTQKETGVNQYLGKAVAIDGYYAISADDSGGAYLYTRQADGTWESSAIVCSSGSGDRSSFGNSISICGNYFVIGEPLYNSGTGRVDIYGVDDTSTPLQTINGTSGSQFGYSVCMTEDYIAVGSPNYSSNAGEAYIYINNHNGTWSSYGHNPIIPEISNSNDYFGCSVGLYNTDCFIGARGDNQATGAVYLFERNGSTYDWDESSKLLASDGRYNDQFGGCLSVSDGYMASGAKFWDSDLGETNAGAVYIFKKSSSWYEVDKITGIDESSYVGNKFGSSISLKNDYLIIGSPEARTYGVVDIFYKKRGWNHLIKLVASDAAEDDGFGCAVDISGFCAVVGANLEGGGDNGAIYFFKNPPVYPRLAQEFEVNQGFVPSKASLLLRRAGSNAYSYWRISNSSKNVIDSTNFSTITAHRDRVILDDVINGHTGNGCMFLERDDHQDYDIINYPIRAVEADTFYLWIRCINTVNSVFVADILMDGHVAKTISTTISDPSANEWSWVGTTLVIPDTNEHTLGIKLKEEKTAIDKIYIDVNNITPYADGPDYQESPYLTAHLRLYASNGSPSTPIFAYDHKNSITQIVQDDWYNFNIKVIDDHHGYTAKEDFVGSYFLVFSCSGSFVGNYIIWDMIENDEYISFLSAFKI